MIKWFLGVIGFQFAGFFGALLGFFIGSGIDRSLRFGVGAINPLTTMKRQESFLKTTFTLMGAIAKADGHISKDEINQVEHFISQIGMTPEHRKQAIDYFQQGAAPDFSPAPLLDEFKAHCGQTRNLTQVLLSYLISVALADGVLDPAEKAILENIALNLGFSEQEFAQLMAMIGAQDHFSGSRAHPKATIDDAYKALGVEPSDTDKQVKRAYRSLVSKYHPDKLIGQGLPEDMIKDATERTQEIQLAYDAIMDHRKSTRQ